MATGTPCGSVIRTHSPSAPDAVARTRTVVAPTAWSRTPVHANGSIVGRSSPVWKQKFPACRVASSSAGWMPNRPATPVCSSGTDTSANTSSSRFHTARRPRNAGPYSYPTSARCS